MDRDPWLAGHSDDFFDGDDTWEEGDGAPSAGAEETTGQWRPSWSRGDDGGGGARGGTSRRLPRTWLGVVALVVVIAIVLAVVLTGGGGANQTTVSTDQTLPSTTVPTTASTEPTAPPAPAPAPIVVRVPAGKTLSVGDSGPAVRALQRALKRVGHDPGAADGTFGAGTAAAVTAFQKGAGLKADGIVGPATARALTRTQRNAG